MSDEVVPNRRRDVSRERHAPELFGPSFELIERAPFPYLILSLRGAVVHANNAAVLLLGEQISAKHQLPLIALVSRTDQTIYMQWLYRARFEPQTLVLTLVPFGGGELEVRLVSDLARVDGYVFILVAIDDLRELRRAEHRLGTLRNQLEWRVRERNHELAHSNEQLKQKIDECGVLELELRHRMQELGDADRAKDEFLALLAHELRNPLAPIRNALEVMRQDSLDTDTRVWAQGVIERQVEHLRRLVDDLLDLSRISRGKIELRRTPMDLTQAVERAIELSGPMIASRRHRLERRHWRGSLLVEGDLERLAQAIGNLLNNASKYTEPGGVIGIELERDGDNACLVVRDSGHGIEPELLPRVFDPFTQGDHSLHRTQGGLGIGLALVKRIVELHGGEVVARSAGSELGSEFEMRLPCWTGEAPADIEPEAALGSRPQRRVLIVEDNVDAGETLRMLLEMHGHTAQVAYDAASALGVAREFRPDALLLDIGLPDMSGRELVGILRSRSETAGAVIVAVSGYGTDRDIEASRAAGFDQHLVKPVRPEALEAALALHAVSPPRR